MVSKNRENPGDFFAINRLLLYQEMAEQFTPKMSRFFKIQGHSGLHLLPVLHVRYGLNFFTPCSIYKEGSTLLQVTSGSLITFFCIDIEG